MAKKGNFTIEELLSLPNFYFPTASPDRLKVAFYWDKTGRVELFVMDLSTKEINQVSKGQLPRSPRAGFIWTRDSKTIIFAKDKEGNEQFDLYKLDIETGESSVLVESKGQHYPGEASYNGNWITLLSNRDGQMNLYKVKLDGTLLKKLTDLPNPVFGGDWHPSDEWITVQTNETSDLKNQDIYIVKADGSELRKIVSMKVGSRDSPGTWSKDGKLLPITSDASGISRAGLYHYNTGKTEWFGKGEYEEHSICVTDDNRSLIAIRNKDASYRSILYDIESKEVRELKLPEGLVTGSQLILEGDSLLLNHQDPTHRPRLLAYDFKKDSYDVLIDAIYGRIDLSLFAGCEYISYKSTDDLTIYALLYKPRDILSGERLPAVVFVHGGPTAQDIRIFNSFVQVLVDQGYVVLQPNYRGSTGYGYEFEHMNIKDWGGGDLEDVAKGAEYLKGLPYVDPNRIAIFGGSYGGYMTYMQLVKRPDLWAAGVAWIGITDLKKLYDSSMEHFKYFLRMYMGNPSENADLWKERSAITYASHLRAPLLITHGLNDPRCPVEQARIFKNKLIELGYKEGKDFEYVELGEEGHGSIDIEQKIKSFNLRVDFLNRRV